MNKALELAEWADLQCDPGSECAVELRRLAEVNADLLEALQDMVESYQYEASAENPALLKARAAIKKATE